MNWQPIDNAPVNDAYLQGWRHLRLLGVDLSLEDYIESVEAVMIAMAASKDAKFVRDGFYQVMRHS